VIFLGRIQVGDFRAGFVRIGKVVRRAAAWGQSDLWMFEGRGAFGAEGAVIGPADEALLDPKISPLIIDRPVFARPFGRECSRHVIDDGIGAACRLLHHLFEIATSTLCVSSSISSRIFLSSRWSSGAGFEHLVQLHKFQFPVDRAEEIRNCGTKLMRVFLDFRGGCRLGWLRVGHSESKFFGLHQAVLAPVSPTRSRPMERTIP